MVSEDSIEHAVSSETEEENEPKSKILLLQHITPEYYQLFSSGYLDRIREHIAEVQSSDAPYEFILGLEHLDGSKDRFEELESIVHHWMPWDLYVDASCYSHVPENYISSCLEEVPVETDSGWDLVVPPYKLYELLTDCEVTIIGGSRQACVATQMQVLSYLGIEHVVIDSLVFEDPP